MADVFASACEPWRGPAATIAPKKPGRLLAKHRSDEARHPYPVGHLAVASAKEHHAERASI
eukprot:10488093-Karenia_brevis.AAC.1